MGLNWLTWSTTRRITNREIGRSGARVDCEEDIQLLRTWRHGSWKVFWISIILRKQQRCVAWVRYLKGYMTLYLLSLILVLDFAYLEDIRRWPIPKLEWDAVTGAGSENEVLLRRNSNHIASKEKVAWTWSVDSATNVSWRIECTCTCPCNLTWWKNHNYFNLCNWFLCGKRFQTELKWRYTYIYTSNIYGT